ncbi:non-functional pseudokinase ZED1-like [Euphorbia lathyris]|uniref:non-functional pseudokinase ZED1-like n=1 Tax=Euphorbia lathyris TaxID=212925 RepID=UPI003313762C
MITFCNSKCSIPIKSFSAKELQKATNNFDEKQLLGGCSEWCGGRGGWGNYYKGFLQDRPVLIKKCIYDLMDNPIAINNSINEIVYTSGTSVHRNVLKLLGCCLETDCPTLVFEYAEGQALADRIIDQKDVPWNVRLKIAIDLANAVAYLHTAFPRPIVHRNINVWIVFLDGNSAAKLSDFSLCVSIPEGEMYVEDVRAGSVGVVAPESYASGYFNEKSDVYSFGVLLLVLLTGQRSIDNTRVEFLLVNHVKKYLGMNRFKEIFDPFILAEAAKEQQFESVGALAIKCIDDSAKTRPTMIEVAKELIRIYQSAIAAC